MFPIFFLNGMNCLPLHKLKKKCKKKRIYFLVKFLWGLGNFFLLNNYVNVFKVWLWHYKMSQFKCGKGPSLLKVVLNTINPNLNQMWEAWEGSVLFFFKYFLKLSFNYLAGVISLWHMAVPFILPTSLFRRESRRKRFF